MPSPDLTYQVQQLRDTARGLRDLHERVGEIDCAPGTDALRTIGPLLIGAHRLAAGALARLNDLDAGPYAGLAGSRSVLKRLSSAVAAASLAAADLAGALYSNAWNGRGQPGYPAETKSSRTTRHAVAAKELAVHAADAAHQLDLAATACTYLANDITQRLSAAKPHKAPPAQRAQADRPSPTRAKPPR